MVEGATGPTPVHGEAGPGQPDSVKVLTSEEFLMELRESLVEALRRRMDESPSHDTIAKE